MQHVEVTRWFAAPPDRTWEIYTDHARWSEWSGLPRSSLEKLGRDDPNGSGAVRAFTTVGFRILEEVVDFDPPKRMTYRIVGGAVPMKNHLGEVIFEPDRGGTRIVWRCRFDSKLPFVGGLQRRVVERVFTTALAGLERRLAR